MQKINWAITLPLLSILGSYKIRRAAKLQSFQTDNFPARKGHILITGSGPSLDNMSESTFDEYDELICINFSIKRFQERKNVTFFTTDVGVLIKLIEDIGWDTFERLGPDRCLVAPLFFEQFFKIKRQDRKKLTWIAPDSKRFKLENLNSVKLLNQYRIPYSFRAYPAQLDKSDFYKRIQSHSKSDMNIPVLEHSSALSAVCLSSLMGAKKIDLIGCDFSDGRAQSVNANQPPPTSTTFSEAAKHYVQLEEELLEIGFQIRNLSWDPDFSSKTE